MSQRNPMNERYTTDDKGGKTRKSAASAKPATKAASSVHVPGQSEKPKGFFARASAKASAGDAKREQAKRNAKAGNVSPDQRALMYNPQIPEYKQWRRYWWMAIGGAILFTVSSFIALSTVEDGNQLPFVLLGIGYVFLAFAIIIDFVKVRRIRKAYQTDVLENRSKDATKSRKERKAAEKQRLIEAEAEEQRRQEEREARKQARSDRWGKVFGRGKEAAENAILPKEGTEGTDAAAANAKAQGKAATAQNANADTSEDTGKAKKQGRVAKAAATAQAAQAAAALDAAAAADEE